MLTNYVCIISKYKLNTRRGRIYEQERGMVWCGVVWCGRKRGRGRGRGEGEEGEGERKGRGRGRGGGRVRECDILWCNYVICK